MEYKTGLFLLLLGLKNIRRKGIELDGLSSMQCIHYRQIPPLEVIKIATREIEAVINNGHFIKR
jgi:hypothetical protein